MKIRIYVIYSFMILTIIAVLSSCNEHYEGKLFSFPPSSKPHDKSWKFLGNIKITSEKVPFYLKSNKKVNIKIKDLSENYILNEDIEFNSVSIRSKVIWDKFENIIIELNEVGNQFAEDKFNKQLVKSGPNLLIKLKYEYDQVNQTFKRVN